MAARAIEADLHVHSHHSDGVLPPAQVVARAAGAGLSAIALTDHDTLQGIAEARAAAPAGFEVIPGVEVSSSFLGHEVHLLVYFIEPDDAELEAALAPVRVERRRRAARMVDRLNALGIPVTMDEVVAAARAAGTADTGSIGRPHIAEALIAHGAASDMDDAFARYLRRGQPGYVAKTSIPCARAIQLAHARGGVVVVAHPGLNLSVAETVSLAALGLDGIEAWHPKHAADQQRELDQVARRLKLVASGGSDFHGEGRGRHDLGESGVSLQTLEALRARRPAPG
jgi:predicted metal-dependent phosphoesterase TrpH